MPDTSSSLPLKYEKSLTSLENSTKNERITFQYVIGVDEAGRGPLAGPVIVAAIAVPLGIMIDGINDSKAVGEEAREKSFEDLIKTPGVVYSIEQRDNDQIDEMNILAATLDGMAVSSLNIIRAVSALQWDPHASEQQRGKPVDAKDYRDKALPNISPEGLKVKVLVDGNKVPPLLKRHEDVIDGQAVVKGDATVFSIAAASILAKVTRDRVMKDFDKQYPGYGFSQHKGYPTATHVKACSSIGVSRIHRMTFNPLKTWLIGGKITLPEGMTRTFLDLRSEEASNVKKRGNGGGVPKSSNKRGLRTADKTEEKKTARLTSVPKPSLSEADTSCTNLETDFPRSGHTGESTRRYPRRKTSPAIDSTSGTDKSSANSKYFSGASETTRRSSKRKTSSALDGCAAKKPRKVSKK